MLNPCARCNKTVYPTEKLSCLDKTWHKGCFNCETCNMTLSMKTYKGYNKLPYCNVHYPTTKFTAVADTPENMRLKKNTTNQSTAVYHKDFIQEKAKFTAVADDPETLRLKKSQTQASQISYQKDGAAQPSGYIPAEAGHIDQGPRKDSITAQAPPPQAAAQEEVRPAIKKYVALYDYTAADDDEVTFGEGDIIVDVSVIDDGWMTGTVERTGQTGMLPSNYVEPQ